MCLGSNGSDALAYSVCILEYCRMHRYNALSPCVLTAQYGTVLGWYFQKRCYYTTVLPSQVQYHTGILPYVQPLSIDLTTFTTLVFHIWLGFVIIDCEFVTILLEWCGQLNYLKK
jgi:hypothetical protein